jgi:hypothetical protein
MRNIKITSFPSTKAYKESLKAVGVGSLLSVGSDSKTVRGEKMGYITAILYMVPNIQTCANSLKAGCLDPCLVSAGRGAFSNVHAARLNRTNLYAQDRSLFYSALHFEISKLYAKHGDKLVVRLNGTSDIMHERNKLTYGDDDDAPSASIIEMFSQIGFYDYSKLLFRATSELPSNYDLTLSYSGFDEQYAKDSIRIASETGKNLAVVFSGKFPETWNGLPVIRGDDTDLRLFDEKGVIVGLKAIGKAVHDTTGFVVHLPN